MLLPEWYLPNGTINASDQRLEGASSSCERWGIGFATIVVVAVVAELVIAWVEPPYLLFLTESAVADAVIAIGIAGEVLLGTIWNNRIQTELRKRSNEKVAAAVDRATEAQNTLIKLLTPRRSILRPHMERIATELEKFSRTKFDIGFGGSDLEQSDLCWDIEEMLAAAKWDQQQWGTITFGPAIINDRGPSRPRAGQVAAQNVEIHVDPDFQSSLRPAVKALIAALTNIGIEATWKKFNSRSANAEAMHIHIGAKAPPVAPT